MKRYDLITNYRCGSSIEEMEQADDGEWVRYEDVEPIGMQTNCPSCASLIAAREALRDEVERRINDALSLRETNRALSRQVRDLMALLVGEK